MKFERPVATTYDYLHHLIVEDAQDYYWVIYDALQVMAVHVMCYDHIEPGFSLRAIMSDSGREYHFVSESYYKWNPIWVTVDL